jgi:hypothetical protein
LIFSSKWKKTDAFVIEQSVAQAMASAFGVKLGSYPRDVLTRNMTMQMRAEMSEIDKNIYQLQRQLQTKKIDQAEYQDEVQSQINKKQKLLEEYGKKLN